MAPVNEAGFDGTGYSPSHALKTAPSVLLLDAKIKLLALILLSIDLAFIVIHYVVVISGGTEDSQFHLYIERSYPEIFNYGKYALIAFVFASIWLRRSHLIYLAWAVLFAFIGLDDSFELHERGGRVLAWLLDLPVLPGLREVDTGELLAWAMLGPPVLGALVIGFLRCPPGHRGANAAVAALFAMLVFFALGVDLLHVAAKTSLPVPSKAVGAVEDGGEMVVASLICVFVFLLSRHLTSFLDA